MQIPKRYLTVPTSVVEVQAQFDFANCHPDFRADWERLLSKMQDGDKLWRFEPPANEHEIWGIALVRNGEVVSTLIEAVG
jgi:hypothetical protein